MEQATILVVDDDREIVGAIAKLLELDGHRVLRSYDGLEALEILHEQTVHLIILDVMMPRMDGLSATMQVRREKNVPILLLSAKTEDADKIAGLSIGADDYMTKPYNPMELAARVKALLRRYMTLGTVAGAPARPGVIQLGGLALDTQAKILEVDGEPVRLTATEYRIVQFLMENPGHVFSASEIYEHAWNEPGFGVENTVMVHIRRIREKIEIDPKNPNYLKVVWGLGYKMEKFSRSPVLKFLALALTALVALAGLGMTVRRIDLSDVYTTQPQFTDSSRYTNLVAMALNDCAVVTQEGRVYGEIHYEYLIRAGEDVWTNSDRDLEQIARAGGDWVYRYTENELIVPDGTSEETRQMWHGISSWSNADELILVMDEDYMQQMEEEYDRDYAFVQQWQQSFWFVMAAIGLLVVYLLAVAGRTGQDNELHLLFVDRWPTEILLGVEAILAVLLMMALLVTSDSLRGDQAYALMAIDLAIGLVGLALLLSLARKAKAGRLWADSILHHICRGIAWLCRGETWRVSGRVGRQAVSRILWTGMSCMTLCVLLCLFLYVFFGARLLILATALLLGMVCVAGMLYLLVMQARDGRALDALTDQVEAAASGQETRPTLPEESPLHKTSLQIARLDEGVKQSLASALKSERMKVELITNVSHDLKTPLTSIIGYLDLLEKQDLPAEAADYVKILRRKSERLSHTVNDLFTLSKATSGEETVILEPLDLVMAVNQTLADMGDAVEKAGIPVRPTLPESAWVFAENRRLYRVLQNILDNALRYSLQGTRIYLEVESRPDQVCLSLTNTAGYEMDFTEEEILQRFVRGDKSRTTEGSGLGLSIAESFMNSFGGRLKVSIRGDAFTVTLSFAAAPANPPDLQEKNA